MNRKAEMGVGTLIIFISLLLVAAVAAGVLIQTAGSLQQQALSTGSQATGQISTNALALEVSATDGSNGDVDTFDMLMRLAPGSDSIRLDAATLSFSTTDSTQSILYNQTAVNGTATHFAVEYLQEGANHQEGVLVAGDVIRVQFVSSTAINQSENVRINFIPQIGTATLVQFSLPDVISTQRVYLYP